MSPGERLKEHWGKKRKRKKKGLKPEEDIFDYVCYCEQNKRASNTDGHLHFFSIRSSAGPAVFVMSNE